MWQEIAVDAAQPVDYLQLSLKVRAQEEQLHLSVIKGEYIRAYIVMFIVIYQMSQIDRLEDSERKRAPDPRLGSQFNFGDSIEHNESINEFNISRDDFILSSVFVLSEGAATGGK